MTGLCECGCGQATPLATQTRSERGQIKGQPVRFINGHNARLPRSAEHNANVGAALRGRKRPQARGANNPAWRGDGAGYDALHKWLNKHHPRLGICWKCGDGERRTSWAFLRHPAPHTRDISDYRELCGRCHKLFDLGRLP